MRHESLHEDHPVDELPDHLRGRGTDAAAIERHLAGCASCRSELELLAALEEASPAPLGDAERERVFRALAAPGSDGANAAPPGGAAHGRASGGQRWLSVTWRLAAGIALVLTSVGVLRIVQEGATPDWDPALALEGWGEEVADLGLGAGDVRLALGVGLLDDPTADLAYDEATADLEGLTLPWEEDDR